MSYIAFFKIGNILAKHIY